MKIISTIGGAILVAGLLGLFPNDGWAAHPLPGLTALGSDLDGVWEGMFQLGGDAMPVAFTVATVEGKSTVAVDILDQNAMDIPVTAANRDGAHLHFDVGAVAGVFDGTLTSDGAGIQGIWTQVGKHVPLVLKRRTGD